MAEALDWVIDILLSVLSGGWVIDVIETVVWGLTTFAIAASFWLLGVAFQLLIWALDLTRIIDLATIPAAKVAESWAVMTDCVQFAYELLGALVGSRDVVDVFVRYVYGTFFYALVVRSGFYMVGIVMQIIWLGRNIKGLILW